MEQGQIACPHCGQTFEITDVLTSSIREHVKAEFQQELIRKEEDLKKRGENLQEQKMALAEKMDLLEEDIENKVKERLSGIETKVAKQMEGQYADSLKSLQNDLNERDAKISEYRSQEIELRKMKRQLEEANEEAELLIVRRLDEERQKIKEDAFKKANEEHRLKDLEKDKVINDLKVSLGDMKRKAEQGSMETQGEVFEQDFEIQLKTFFPYDDIRPVPKGVRGADIVHSVRTPFGQECGLFLWETKNTKSWNVAWVSKLKEDAINARATIPILVSTALPNEITRFGLVGGVWVSDPFCALPLAVALREQLIAVNRERMLSSGKNEKLELVYQYLSGTEFKQKVEGIVEAFTSMQEQLNQERRVMERHWNQREKQIHRVIKNTAGLYGDLQGIIGVQIPAIPALELESPPESDLPSSSVEYKT